MIMNLIFFTIFPKQNPLKAHLNSHDSYPQYWRFPEIGLPVCIPSVLETDPLLQPSRTQGDKLGIDVAEGGSAGGSAGTGTL